MKKKLLFGTLFFTVFLEADSISFAFYNDFFAGSDGHFTSGAALSWLEDNKKKSYTKMLLSLAQDLSIELDSTKNYNGGMRIEQLIVTPQNTDVATIQYDDIPYAGYLCLSAFLVEWDKNSFNEYSIDVGVMGRESGAEFIQKTFHKMIGSDQPQGWDTQLSTRYTLNVLVQHGVISWQGKVGDRLQSDWFNHCGASVGNFYVSAFAGSAIRIGHNYVKNFNVHYPYLRGEANLIQVDSLKHGFGWSTSAGVETNILAYSAILDRAKNNGYAVHKNILNGLAHISASIYYNQHKFKLFYEIPTPYTQEDKQVNIFGGFEYSYIF